MPGEPLDWTVPAPLRALLWWPPVALVVAVVEPSAAEGTIAVAGAVLAVLGVLVSSVGRAVARRHADAPASVTALPGPALAGPALPGPALPAADVATPVLERQAA